MLLISIVNHKNVTEIIQLLNQLSNYNINLFKVHLIDNSGDFNNVCLNYDFLIIRKFDGVTRGFGANHNLSLLIKGYSHICILNPDVQLISFDIEEMLESQNSVCTAVTLNSKGQLNDFVRYESNLFFTVFSRFFSNFRNGSVIDDRKVWFSGAFLLVNFEDFKKSRGFDEKYFMYYEDADLCRRFRNSGLIFKILSKSVIIHDGKRASLSNFNHFIWHLKSFIRFHFNV
jgi:N-acetylglucosaminyl-diphospho-decaprenol L-rhamnosyltransferase